VNGILDIGANTGAATLAGITGAVTTGSNGLIKSATATPAVIQALLSKATTAKILQTAHEDTTLTIGTDGKITMDNAAAKKLIVAGRVVIDGGTFADAIYGTYTAGSSGWAK
jgi:hypothetical protein